MRYLVGSRWRQWVVDPKFAKPPASCCMMDGCRGTHRSLLIVVGTVSTNIWRHHDWMSITNEIVFSFSLIGLIEGYIPMPSPLAKVKVKPGHLTRSPIQVCSQWHSFDLMEISSQKGATQNTSKRFCVLKAVNHRTSPASLQNFQYYGSTTGISSSTVRYCYDSIRCTVLKYHVTRTV